MEREGYALRRHHWPGNRIASPGLLLSLLAWAFAFSCQRPGFSMQQIATEEWKKLPGARSLLVPGARSLLVPEARSLPGAGAPGA